MFEDKRRLKFCFDYFLSCQTLQSYRMYYRKKIVLLELRSNINNLLFHEKPLDVNYSDDSPLADGVQPCQSVRVELLQERTFTRENYTLKQKCPCVIEENRINTQQWNKDNRWPINIQHIVSAIIYLVVTFVVVVIIYLLIYNVCPGIHLTFKYSAEKMKNTCDITGQGQRSQQIISVIAIPASGVTDFEHVTVALNKMEGEPRYTKCTHHTSPWR